MEKETQPEKGADVGTLQAQYRVLVWQSKKLSAKDKKSAFDFLERGEGHDDAATLKKLIAHFGEAEQKAEELEKLYEEEIRTEISAGRFAAASKEKYMKWFKDLSYAEKVTYAREKKSDLHKPERQKLLDIF